MNLDELLDKFEFDDTGWWLVDERGEPKPVTLKEWVEGMRTRADRGFGISVKQETVGRSWISTVLLTVHFEFRPGKKNRPKWETMVFDGACDGGQWTTFGSREQAEAQHTEVTKIVRRAERWWLWLPHVIEFFNDQLYDWRYTKLCLTNLLS